MTHLELTCIASAAVFMISGVVMYRALVHDMEDVGLPAIFICSITGIVTAITGAALLICEIIKAVKA